VDRGKLLKAEHGASWRDRPECERIARDIEVICRWYQGWFWSQPERQN
jgi:hypothetical protein